MFNSLYELLGYTGFWVLVIYSFCKVFKGLWTCWLGTALGCGARLNGERGKWAVITGSTDGIGLEYAKQFAKRNYSLLLLSRSGEKLTQVKDDIKKTYNVEIETHAVDFSRRDIYGEIERKIGGLEGSVDVLINNVGISYPYAEYMTKLPDADNLIDSIININIVSFTRMIKIVLPLMEKRKKGLIINVSSLSGAYPTPLLTLYAASKAYVDFMSRALQEEYETKGIIVQSVLPAYVATKMSKISRASFMAPSPADYVEGAMNTIGIETRTYGYYSHKIQGFVQDNIISTVLGPDYNIKLALSALKQTRSKYYKKHGLKDIKEE